MKDQVTFPQAERPSQRKTETITEIRMTEKYDLSHEQKEETETEM